MKAVLAQVGHNFAGPRDWRRKPMKLSLWLAAAGAALMASALETIGLDPDPMSDIVALELFAAGWVMLAIGFATAASLSVVGMYKQLIQKHTPES